MAGKVVLTTNNYFDKRDGPIAARQRAAELYEAFGFDAVDAGGLDNAWRLDVDQPAFVVRMNKQELLANLDKAQRHVTAA